MVCIRAMASDFARFIRSEDRRLVRPLEFGRVKSEGTAHRGPTLVLACSPTTRRLFRAGFVTSKRIGRGGGANQFGDGFATSFGRNKEIAERYLVGGDRPSGGRAGLLPCSER